MRLWVVLALLAALWGLLGLTVYLAVVRSLVIGVTAPWTLVLCLYATGLVWKMIQGQREETK